MKSTKKPLFNPYGGLFARFARKKWEGFGLCPKPKHFSPTFCERSEQKRLLLWYLPDFTTCVVTFFYKKTLSLIVIRLQVLRIIIN
jgi:hypothetical protein